MVYQFHTTRETSDHECQVSAGAIEGVRKVLRRQVRTRTYKLKCNSTDVTKEDDVQVDEAIRIRDSLIP